ncbi:MAG: acylphosphatase [Ginsengibacter sp.]
METVHLLISGKVQGVFYRATAKKMAEGLRINGWIKNIPNKKVEAIISGEPSQVNEFIKWCKKGPAGADVKDVTITALAETDFFDFKIIR